MVTSFVVNISKISSSIYNTIQEWISSENKDTEVIINDEKMVFCNLCGKTIGILRKCIG